MTLADIKRRFTPGSRWAVTNHYITREDHPAFGTTVRTVTRATTAGVYLAYADGKETRIDWPKASEAIVTDDAVEFRNHPQHRGEPFLTFQEVT